ncbi:MAG: hypothetical protein PHV32_15575 [Eubacteriales bacterium]|nr:hypothetical protein [Eubacteriales bacterium]
MKTRERLYIFIILLCIFPLINGCGKKEEKNNKNGATLGSESSGDKSADILEEIELTIEEIFLNFDGPTVKSKEEKSEEKSADGKSSNSGQSSTGQSSNKESAKKPSGGEGEQGKDKSQSGNGEGGGEKKQSQSNGEGGGQKEQSQSNGEGGGQKEQSQSNSGTQTGGQGTSQVPNQESQGDVWVKADSSINRLHYQWNSYMPEAAKLGAGKDLLGNFSIALDSLTNTIIGKNKTNTLLAASLLYANIPDLYALHKKDSSPEIKRIRHYTRNAMLNAYTANWVQSATDLENLINTWSIYKNTVSPEQHDAAVRLDFSISELNRVLTEQNQPLCDIKGRIVLSNVRDMEKAQEEQGKSSKSKGS